LKGAKADRSNALLAAADYNCTLLLHCMHATPPKFLTHYFVGSTYFSGHPPSWLQRHLSPAEELIVSMT